MLLVLILSQGYWLYNIYNAEKYKTQEVLEELFEEAIKQEMSKRMVSNKPKDPNSPKRIIRRASDMTPEERAKLKGDVKSKVVAKVVANLVQIQDVRTVVTIVQIEAASENIRLG